MTKRIFLDCGSNLGQGFEEFRTWFGDTDIVYILFEPDEKCYQKLCEKYSELDYVQINNCAVSTVNTLVDFYTTRDFDLGGTVVYDHNNNYYDNCDSKKVQVQAIDLITLINQLANNSTEIILKLDVESSEYDILEKMINTGTIHSVDTIFCEFHSQYMKEPEKSKYQQREDKIMTYVKDNNIKLNLWK